MARPRPSFWPRRILLLLLTTVLAGAVIYNFFPRLALKGLSIGYALRSGVTEKTIDLNGYPVPYFEGGQGPALLMVHGYGDSHIAFLQSARWLTPAYRVVLPTVPGFGETAHDPARDYSIRGQVEFLRTFTDALGIPSFDLVGNSMGGHIAAAFTLRYPERVRKLVLLNPAGLRVDNPVPYEPVQSPIRNEEDWDRYLSDVFYKKPWAPAPFVRLFIENSRKNFEWSNFLRAQIRAGEDYILNDRVGDLALPVLVFWGRHDRVIRPVHAPQWERRVPGARLILREDIGHAPQYEQPEDTARMIADFLRE